MAIALGVGLGARLAAGLGVRGSSRAAAGTLSPQYVESAALAGGKGW